MSLATFTDSYIECALWSSTDEAGEPLDQHPGDLAQATTESMKSDCEDFYGANAHLWQSAGLSDEQAGHDFWLTRNGHGAGFWDRGIGDTGTQLSDLCKPYGGIDLYVGDDGAIYG